MGTQLVYSGCIDRVHRFAADGTPAELDVYWEEGYGYPDALRMAEAARRAEDEIIVVTMIGSKPLIFALTPQGIISDINNIPGFPVSDGLRRVIEFLRERA